MSESQTTREPGYYWVRHSGDERIFEWRSDVWLRPGRVIAVEEADVEVLSRRLVLVTRPPSHTSR